VEKRLESSENLKKIAIIGPECTGKTILSEQLAVHYNTVWIPEYAREYVEKLQRSYVFEDLEIIARNQIAQINARYTDAHGYVFFDTDLIITKVWFDIVFNKVPGWLNSAIAISNFDLYLLCDIDIPWKPDPVRENGGEMRKVLFNIYKQELENRYLQYKIISGTGNERTENAIGSIDNFEW
jgi:NadR type nicotinamide-nucleotide adenylyltransferase